MLLAPVASGNIAAAGYDPVTAELQIQFRTGRIYTYQGIPPDVYAAFLDAPSKGSFFAQNIKKLPGYYPDQRIL